MKSNILLEKNFRGGHTIVGVNLDLSSSTSRAEVFNMAVELATFDWQDPILEQVRKLIDERVEDIENGTDYELVYERASGSTFNLILKAVNKTRAEKLGNARYGEYKLISCKLSR